MSGELCRVGCETKMCVVCWCEAKACGGLLGRMGCKVCGEERE